MGRQAYMTRLALGRSPFGPPELTETGEFILGPNAHEFDNLVDGHQQEFDEQGHPVNKAAAAAAKALRKAQNDVLATVGVVVKKEQQKSEKKRQINDAKLAAIVQENSYGSPWLKVLDLTLLIASSWWLTALRRRIQTFKSFSDIALLEIIKSEMRHLGTCTFLFSGLTGWFLTVPIACCRGGVIELAVDAIMQKLTGGKVRRASQRRYIIGVRILCYMLDTALLVLDAPLLFFSDLQTLHLIPDGTKPNVQSFVPFTNGSPICLPRLANLSSTVSVIQFGTELLASHICVGWIFDHVRLSVESTSYRLMRAIVPRPDQPDRLSRRAAKLSDEDGSTIAGLGVNSLAGTGFQDYQTLISFEIQEYLDTVARWCGNILRRITPQAKSPPLSEGQVSAIQLHAKYLEEELIAQLNAERGVSPTVSEELEARRVALRLSFRQQGLTPPDDITTWYATHVARRESTSTTTPEPEELFIPEEMQGHGGEPTGGLQLPDQAAGTASERADLVPSSSQLSPDPVHQSPVQALEPGNASQAWHAIEQGVTEAQPLDYDQLTIEGNGAEAVTVRRMLEDRNSNVVAPNERVDTALPAPIETEGYDNHEHETEMWDVANEFPGMPRRRGAQTPPGNESNHNGWQWPAQPPPQQHRVTTLSNYPADAFVSHASYIMTTAIMLPLESLYVRSLARAFLASPSARPGAAQAALGIRADIRGLGDWFGGPGGGLMGRVRYAGTMLLLLGLQGVICAGIGSLGTGLAVWIGRKRFGWGSQPQSERKEESMTRHEIDRMWDVHVGGW